MKFSFMGILFTRALKVVWEKEREQNSYFIHLKKVDKRGQSFTPFPVK